MGPASSSAVTRNNEHNEPGKYLCFYAAVRMAEHQTDAELGAVTRRVLNAAADGARLCIGRIKGEFADDE